MTQFPARDEEYFKAVARETARMSYPGRMGGILEKGTKEKVERYFEEKFPLKQLWDHASEEAYRFDDLHQKIAIELAGFLDEKKCLKKESDKSEAVAAKLLNTFMYQLMKYEPCRPLWRMLHLPLDRMMLNALSNLDSPSLFPISKIITAYKEKPYQITYINEYKPIQNALRHLIEELNKQSDIEYKLTSRIQLNLLWVGKGSRKKHGSSAKIAGQ